MKVTEKTSRAGTALHRLFSVGGGKIKPSKRVTALGLTALMVVNTIFVTEPISAVAATADLEDGLVGYYTFDNTLENVVAGGGSATLHGGAGDTWGKPTGTASYIKGKNGQAYNFQGDSTTQILVGTEWWNGTQTGYNYTLEGDGTLTWTVECTADMGGYAAFNVELVDGSGHYITTGSDGNAWYAGPTGNETGDAITGVLPDSEKGSVIKAGTTYTITVKRSTQQVTITYFDQTSGKQFTEYVAANTNLDSKLSIHMIAQVGTFAVTNTDVSVRGTGLELDVDTSSEYTISYWVNPDTVNSATSMVFVPTLVNGNNEGLSIADNWFGETFPTARIWGSAVTTTVTGAENNAAYMDNFLTSADELCGKWTYITLTMDANGKSVLYVNGSQVATASSIAGVFAGKDIFLGVNFWDASFDGLMDDVAIYNRALSADEVGSLYANNGIPGDIEISVTPAHVSVHDPSIIKDEKNDMYYVFGSHMAWAKSNDLIHWETFTNNINRDYKTLFAKEAEWAGKGDATYTVDGNMWAPDVIWNETMQKWCMYMSINGRSWNSCICLLTADSLDGDWKYEGPVIYSGFTTSAYSHDFALTDYTKVTGESTLNARYIMDAYVCDVTDTIDGKEVTSKTAETTWNRAYGAHAIDPCVLYDNGKLYMTYGSWSGGIYMIELDASTGLRDMSSHTDYDDVYMGYHLAGGGTVSGEASYIEKVGNYYYLYITLGGLVAAGGYNMRVFRSQNITGPYVDYSGDDAIKQTTSYNSSVGNRIMSGYKWSYMNSGYVAQGHNSAFVDSDGKVYLLYHTRFNNKNEGHELRVHQQFVNEDGWLVTAPFEYTGEDLPETNSVTVDDVAGTYEVLFHKLDIDYANLEVVEGELLSFNTDGTISGDRNGTWKFGTNGSPDVIITLGDTTYKGVFVYQQIEDTRDKTWTFTVLGDDEVSVWGYKEIKELTDQEKAERVADMLSVVSSTNSDIELPVKGLYNADITWTSTNTEVLSATGIVAPKDTDTLVTLTATIKVGSATVTKKFEVTVYSSWIVYYEDFSGLSGTTGNNTGWISPNASEDLSVKTDNDEYGNYLNFAVAGRNSRGAYTEFGLSGINKDYGVTADIKLLKSNDQAPCFAITASGYKYSGNIVNDGIASGYILKLEAQANSDIYTVNDDSDLTVQIPSGTWVHLSVFVDEDGNVSADINGTKIQTKVNGSSELCGMYYRRGRYTAGMSIDNIIVHIHNWGEGEVTTEPTCTTVGEKIYTCSVCGETKTEEVEATGHTYNSASYNSNKITISCEKGDSSRVITLDVAGGSISNFSVDFDKETMTVTLPKSSMVSREGYELEGWKDSAGKEYQAEFDVSTMTSDITLTAIWKDTEPPTGSITVADNKWQTFLKEITFGIYKIRQEVITIEAEDNEAMGTIYYLIATGGTTYTIDEIEALSADKWTEYQDSKKPVLEKDTKNIIYVKLVDKAGNTTYISSDGIVEDETAPEITVEAIAGMVLDTSAKIQITSNEAGTYYFLLKEGERDTGIDADKLIESTENEKGAITEGGKITLEQNGLQKGTLYTAYLVVVDLAGNKSECKTYSFKTVNEIVDITNANISGDMIYHSQLTASAQNAKDLAMSYQWYRSSEAITADTDVSSLDKISCESESYTLQKEDVGNYIAVVISIADESYGGFAMTYTDSAVVPIEITASVKIADKVYDGTNVAEISNITLDGIIAGDDVTANAQAVFADANAAQDKVVTVSNITLSGEDAAAYKLTNTQIETTASISKRPLKITEFTVADKVYDKTTSAEIATLEFEGVVEGEEISYEAAVEFSDANAGVDKTVSGTVKLTGSSTTNYMLEGSDSEGVVEITGKAEIKKAQPEYTIPQNITAVYGSTLRDITLPEGFAFDISGLANGLDTEVGDVGTQELPAVYTPEDTTNYASVNVLIPVTVTKAAKEAPELTVVDETIYGKADGILNGLTTEMEYSTDGTKYISVEDAAMTFAAGTYSVRYKEDNNYLASPAVQVVIKEGRMLKVVFLIDGEETAVRETGWNGEITDIPEIPEKTGYDQTPPRWDVAEFKNIQNDMTVHAVYTINTYAVNLTQGEGYTLQIADSEETAGKVDYLGSCSFKLTVADGYSRTDSFAVKANGVVLTADENGTYSLTDISKDYTITVEGIADLTAPTGEIKVRENIWNTSFAPTAWNLFFNASQTVTITAADKGSGIAEISYYLADTPLTADNVNWIVYKEPFALMPNNEYIVYARIVDKAGNYTYINSEGMILDDIIPAVMVQNNNGFTVISDGAEYERAQTFKVTDAYLDKVFVNNEQISLSEQGTFVLEPSNDKYVITAEDKAGNQASYTISVNKAKGAGNVVMEGWTYGEAAKEPQITDINNTGYTVKYYKGSEELDTAPVNAGDYTVKVTFNETEVYAEYIVSIDYTIKRAEVAAPASIEKTDETISGKNDGTITGLTAEMEYSKDGVNYTDVSGNADADGVITLTGLEPGTYYIRYKTDENHNALVATVTIQAGIVEEPATPPAASSGIPQIKGENGKTGWQVIADEIRKVLEQNQPQQKIDVQMNGSTELPRDIILEIKGRDIRLELDMGAGILWTIDGKTVTGESFRDISMEVILNTDNIPRNILNGITSGKTFKNLTLVHEGEFGFTPVLTINVGRENTSLLAKLYYYNKATGQMELSDSGRVDADGNARFTFTHASEYTIVIDPADSAEEGTTTKPDTGKQPVTGDLQQDIWNRTWIMMIASLMVIAGACGASMKKRKK